jgi:ribA/ribD-fused uncharacterized protein
MRDIEVFDGEYRFLSNFHPSVIVYEGIEYPTVEAAYQAAKFDNATDKVRMAALPSPGAAKRMGKMTQLPVDWEEKKISVMRDLLRLKFQDPELRAKLLETGTSRLVEGNTWGDTFWGICDHRGMNHLGELLMELREELNGKAEQVQ